LAAALDACRPFATGKLICIFGCGGDRDKGKRPIMGEISVSKADVTIVTDDNPRSEEPAAIRAEILRGAQGARELAASIGLEPEVAGSILQTLIRSSLMRQEETRVKSVTAGEGKRALVVGGCGQMGAWFVRFLASQGYGVTIADPAAPEGLAG